MIGEEANVVVQEYDAKTGPRQTLASAHDLRRGCAQRLINLGVSAETLKLIMRHSSFSTTEKHYGALRSAQSAATEVAEKLARAQTSALVGGTEGAQQFSAEELMKIKSLLKAL
jgi:integrase